MIRCFGDLIGEVMEAYIDDIVVKTKQVGGLVADHRMAFGRLKANNIKLKPQKCIINILGAMMLGFLVSERGIESNLKKITAIMRMGSITNLKGLLQVTGCLASLRHFISRLEERRLPIYMLLRKANHFK